MGWPGTSGRRTFPEDTRWLRPSKRTCDILAACGFKSALEQGPGRHGVSNAFFLYLRDPDGHRIELYTGDPDFEPLRWHLSDPQRATFWGVYAPSSWFEEATLVADLEGASVSLRQPVRLDRPAALSK